MNQMRVGIVGYGNLGKGVALAMEQNPDMELVAIFTRRDNLGEGFVPLSQIEAYQDKIDVLLLCGGSATDLPQQGPRLAGLFHTVDTFDTHAKIPAYFDAMDTAATGGNKVALISTGWDPGLFSLSRLLGQAVLPQGTDYTFWGPGVSQGHSDAIRRIDGVENAIQYTVPRQQAVDAVRSGSNPQLTTGEKHQRVCYVVAKAGADTGAIEQAIKTMPHYFADYQTEVHFISAQELAEQHNGMPHGGFVIRSGQTGGGTPQRVEFSLALGSNPEFTASVLLAYGRAVHKLAQQGDRGAKTVLDIPLAYLSPKTPAQLRQELL